MWKKKICKWSFGEFEIPIDGRCFWCLLLPDGVYVFQVEAKDSDSGPNGQVNYRIQYVSGNGQGKFEIDRASGQIYVTARMVRSEQYTLLVEAWDLAVPARNRR